MVELIDDLLQVITQCNEVKHELILVQRSRDFDSHPPVMTMQPLTDLTCWQVDRDEVTSTEDQMVFGHTDSKAFGHKKFEG